MKDMNAPGPTRGKMAGRLMLLLGGNLTNSAMGFIRNIAVARLVTTADFGIASTYAITFALVEMMTQLGLELMIVQDREGNDEKTQAGLQAFQLLRGAIASIILLVIAHPYAAFLGIPEVAWAYQILALMPLVRGFMHFDIFRLQREMRYLPLALTKGGSAILSVAAIVPLALIFRDHRIMLGSVLLQPFFFAAISHLAAERRYRLSLDTALMGRALKFGWPLLANAVILFAIFQGEKLIVGRELGMAELGLFAMAFSLTLMPTLVFNSSAQSFFLPQLSAARDDPERFERLWPITLQAGFVIGLVMALGTAILGPPISALLLGEKYHPMLTLLVWLGIVQAIRGAKSGVSTVTISRAKTINEMASHSLRILAIPVSWWLLLQGHGVLVVAQVAIAGELAALGAGLLLMRWQIGISLRPILLPLMLTLATFLAIGIVAILSPVSPDFGQHLSRWHLLPLATALAALASMRQLRAYVLRRAGRS